MVSFPKILIGAAVAFAGLIGAIETKQDSKELILKHLRGGEDSFGQQFICDYYEKDSQECKTQQCGSQQKPKFYAGPFFIDEKCSCCPP